MKKNKKQPDKNHREQAIERPKEQAKIKITIQKNYRWKAIERPKQQEKQEMARQKNHREQAIEWPKEQAKTKMTSQRKQVEVTNGIDKGLMGSTNNSSSTKWNMSRKNKPSSGQSSRENKKCPDRRSTKSKPSSGQGSRQKAK